MCHAASEENNIKKKVPQKNKKTSETQSVQQKSCRKNKHLGSLPRKISGHFLKWTKKETRHIDHITRKLMTTSKAIQPTADIDNICQEKEEGRGVASIDECVDTTIRGLE